MLVAAVVLALVDFWQVALRAPGSLSPASACWLVGLYVVATATGAALLRVAVRPSPATVRALLLVLGGFLLATETGLRALAPLSPWRPWLVVGCGIVATATFAPLRALGRRRAPASLVVLTGLLFAVGVVGAVHGFGSGRGAAPDGDASALSLRDRPNFLVIAIDTLRADHVGCYGYTRPTTPVLDRLAAEGMLFERAFAQSSWTKPSTASLFTGRFPTQHQTLYERSRLPDSEVTIPEVLGARGYTTAVLSANPWVTPEYGFDQGVDEFASVYDERFARFTLFMMVLKRVSQVADGRMRLYNRVKYLVLGELSTTARDTLLVDQALAWLDTHRARRFFLYLHMMSPHHPYDPPPPFDRFVPDPTRAPVKNYPRKSYDFFAHGDPLPQADLDDMVARYDGDVLYADTEVGRLLDGLGHLGLAQTTVVLVTADHGEEFYDHGNWGHGQSVYNELIRVPLLLRYPPHVPAGMRVAEPVMHVDVLPTLAALAALGPTPTAMGKSLVRAEPSSGTAGGAAPLVLSQLVYRYGEAQALVDGNRKLVTMRRGAEERRDVYDLESDFAERRRLPDDASLEHRLEALLRTLARTKSAASTSAQDDDRERLRALGYAN